jgi:chemotaxis protein CheC
MVTDNNTHQEISLANWANIARIGSAMAVSGLSQMVNRDFKISALNIEEVSLRNATNLIGKPDDRIIGVYLLFTGNTSGHILLAFQPQTAYELIDMAMGVAAGTTHSMGEMERSVLGEMGNIVGTFFLNGVADCVGVRLMPSPPAVVEDMAGALIDSVLAEAFDQNESLFVIKLLFSSTGQETEGRFLVLPSFVVHTDAK